jgi:hypothetical protein
VTKAGFRRERFINCHLATVSAIAAPRSWGTAASREERRRHYLLVHPLRLLITENR